MSEELAVKAGQCIGIDLGTTNSLAAVVAASGGVDVLPNRDQDTITPSVVSLPPKGGKAEAGKYLVGKQAANNARRDPRNTIRSIKRFMGLEFSNPKVGVARQHVSYEVAEDTARAGALVVRLGTNLLTPEEVSAEILRRVHKDAEARLSGLVTHAVITVPAYFTEPQRKATRRAGVLAGLNVKAILDEPTAAALAERSHTSVERGRLLVFDFGGGTLDISLVQVVDKNLNVMSYTGDNFLGGDDIDRGLAHVIKEWVRDQGGEIRDDDYRLEVLLKEEAEKAKKTLAGGAETFGVVLPAACRKKDGSMLDIEMDLTQDHLARVLAPLEDRVRKLLERFLEKESLQSEHLTEVLMVGGSSAVPAFQALLRDLFEKDGSKRVRLARSPMEAVAKGAAIYGQMIKGIKCVKCGQENDLEAAACGKCKDSLEGAAFAFSKAEGGTVSQRLPRSLGVGYVQGDDPDCYQAILKKGALYPTQKPAVEPFQLPAGERFAVHIYEGDEQKASQNQLISVLRVEAPPDVREGDPVHVGFSYDRDRTLFINLSFPSSKSNHQPRWRLDKPSKGDPDEPLQALMEVLPRVRSFLADYRDFIEPGLRVKLQDDMGQAETVIMTGDRKEAVRLRNVMFAALFHGCGVASTLFIAERTVFQDDARYGPLIRELAAKLRQQSQTKDSGREATRKALEELIHKALSERASAPEGDDLRDWQTIKR
jgi:molecular chaperone DnaK